MAAGRRRRRAARLIAQPLSERLGQPIVIENKPGVAGNVGTALFTKEPADGYTILMGSLSPNAVNPHLYSKLGFDPVKDFEFVALMYYVPSFLVVPSKSSANSPQDLVAMAKKNPGKLNFGSGGVGSSQHLFGVMFNTADQDRHRSRHLQGHGARGERRSSPARSTTWSIPRRRCRS